MQVYKYSLLDEDKIVPELKIITSVSPNLYFSKYGKHIKVLHFDLYYGNFLFKCNTLKVLIIEKIYYGKINDFVKMIPESVEEIYFNFDWEEIKLLVKCLKKTNNLHKVIPYNKSKYIYHDVL